jgi:hypothetical protein
VRRCRTVVPHGGYCEARRGGPACAARSGRRGASPRGGARRAPRLAHGRRLLRLRLLAPGPGRSGLAYTLLDTAVLTRVVGWSLAPVRYRDLLPVRAAAYVVSLVNEQVGKGAIAVALRRRHRVPVAASASAMVFIMAAEFLSLSLWACVGYAVGHERLPPPFAAVPWIAGTGLAVVAAGHLGLTRTARGQDIGRRWTVLQAFRRATARRYLEVLGLRAPAMTVAIGVHTVAIGWFGVPVSPGETLGVLPVVLLGAATPGPLRAVSVAMWVGLFPAHPAQMAAFGLLMPLAFVMINALIGLAFLPAASRTLGAGSPTTRPADPSTPPS